MQKITRNVLWVSLSISAAFNHLHAQQSATTKGTLTNLPPVKKVNEADIKSKEISREVAMPKNGEVYIENTSRNIVVKTWDQSKVKLVTTVLYEGEAGNYTDDEWFENAGISLKTIGSSVKIKAGALNSTLYGGNTYNATANGLLTLTNNGQVIHTKGSAKKTVTIYIPAGSKIDVESKYSEVTLPANIGDVNVEISNGNLDAENLGKFILRSQYAIVNIGDVKNAEIEFTGGRLTARNIDDLDLESKYSTIELALAKKVIVRSTNDEYEFEEVGELSGHKNYGNLRITRLLQKIELEGVNADIKIRNIAPSVSLVKIDDKYADIRLPVKNTKNYSVDFTGAYSAVYGNFEKKVPLNLKLSNSNTVSGRIISDTVISGKLSSVNIDKPSITSLGTLTALTVEGRQILPGVSGTITGGTFSGTLSSGTLNYLTVPGTITGGTFSGTLSSYRAEQIQAITALGRLTNLTVSGVVTPSNGQISATTIPMNAINVTGYGISPQNGNTVTGVRTTDTYRTSTGIITGGTYVPFNRAYSYTGDNDTPSKFTASVGDGKGLKIELKCPNCTVDFK